MNRKERRAAEHLARKADRKAGFPITNSIVDSVEVTNPEPIAAPPEKPAISDAQLAANRANAKLSTGAKTEAGKAKVSHNAVKTALTGQTVLLHTDDVAAYQSLGQMFVDHYKPATPEEERLLQCVIDAEWRLRRIPTLEAGIYAVGAEELAGSVPAQFLLARVYLKYERNLKNLSLQENRIRRNREKDLKQLKEIQAARREREAALRKLQERKEKEALAQPQPQPKNGLEFETPEIALETTFQNAA